MAGLFLSKWLDVLSASGHAGWTQGERSLFALVQETVEDIGIDSMRLSKPLSAQVIYAWAAIYDAQSHYGVTQTMNSLVVSYADSIVSQR